MDYKPKIARTMRGSQSKFDKKFNRFNMNANEFSDRYKTRN